MRGHRQRTLLTVRAGIVLAATLLLACAAIFAVAHLQADATRGRDAQLKLVQLRLDLAQIQQVPWGASPDEGDDPNDVRDELVGDEQAIMDTLAQLDRNPGLPERARIERPFKNTMKGLWEIFELVAKGRSDETDKASSYSAHQAAIVDEALAKAATRYRGHSVDLLREARIGSGAVILLLFCAFAFFYRRATRARRAAEALATENRELLTASQHEALTDALTGLGNRRALMQRLEAPRPNIGGEQLLLTLFDLDGFKQYNDTFGHPAGDSLLARLGARLASTMDGIGEGYRMGGDEFCIVASVTQGAADAIAALGAAALSEEGVGFAISCSYGTALMPADTTTPSEALLLADQRMYAQKHSGRVPPSRQSADVLVTLLAERSADLENDVGVVTGLAERTAVKLGLSTAETERIRLGAELHDVGKAAVPDAILNKPGKLDAEEWQFIRRHTVIGERIVRAAPSLAPAADLVRWHHERIDGSGYPDGLRGEDIPVGARIIAVCDAFSAMISERPYRPALSVEGALAELRASAGKQFDPAVVHALSSVIAEGASTTSGPVD
jgi:diguanylate cyclase (GGDEF)-like protein